MSRYFFTFQKAGLDVNGNSIIRVQGFYCKQGNQYANINLNSLKSICVGDRTSKKNQTVTTQLDVNMLLCRIQERMGENYSYAIIGE